MNGKPLRKGKWHVTRQNKPMMAFIPDQIADWRALIPRQHSGVGLILLPSRRRQNPQKLSIKDFRNEHWCSGSQSIVLLNRWLIVSELPVKTAPCVKCFYLGTASCMICCTQRQFHNNYIFSYAIPRHVIQFGLQHQHDTRALCQEQVNVRGTFDLMVRDRCLWRLLEGCSICQTKMMTPWWK